MLLRTKDLKQLLSIIKKTIHTPCEIWAYGSRVNLTAHDTSDLDLVIRTANQTPIPTEELINFKKNLEGSTIPILIQVIDWNSVPKIFHINILKCYENIIMIK